MDGVEGWQEAKSREISCISENLCRQLFDMFTHTFPIFENVCIDIFSLVHGVVRWDEGMSERI